MLLIDIVLLHNLKKQASEILVVGLGSKVNATTILHKLFNLDWLVLAELIKGYFFLFLFDVLIFFSLATARQSLPGKTAS